MTALCDVVFTFSDLHKLWRRQKLLKLNQPLKTFIQKSKSNPIQTKVSKSFLLFEGSFSDVRKTLIEKKNFLPEVAFGDKAVDDDEAARLLDGLDGSGNDFDDDDDVPPSSSSRN